MYYLSALTTVCSFLFSLNIKWLTMIRIDLMIEKCIVFLFMSYLLYPAYKQWLMLACEIDIAQIRTAIAIAVPEVAHSM